MTNQGEENNQREGLETVGVQRSWVQIRTLFRSLIRSGEFHWSARSIEEIAPNSITRSDHYNHQRIKAAWLKEEREKAKALEWARSSIVC